jgi:hypothetical protein
VLKPHHPTANDGVFENLFIRNEHLPIVDR